MALRRIKKEWEDLEKKPLPRISAGPDGDDLFNWNATIEGSENTPYSGGMWHLSIVFPQDYPFNPPEMRWETRIFHCNLSGEKGANDLSCGATSLPVLSSKWSTAWTVAKILCLLRGILDNPTPNTKIGYLTRGKMCSDACILFKNNMNAYNRNARNCTLKYAGKYECKEDFVVWKPDLSLITDGYLRNISRVYSIDVPIGIGTVITGYLQFFK